MVALDTRGAQHDEPCDVLLAHRLENDGDGFGEYVRLFPAACAERRQHRAVAADSVYHCSEIEQVPLNYAKMRIWCQPFRIADEGRDRVPFSQRLRNNELARTPGGAEDDDLHLSPAVPFPLVRTTTLYKVGLLLQSITAQPFSIADI